MPKQNSTDKKILVISSHSFQGIESYDWSQDLPNISDYDVVLLDTPRLFTFWSLAGKLQQLVNEEYFLSQVSQIDEKVRSNICLVKEKLLEILQFNVEVYALYIPNMHIWTLHEYYRDKVEFLRKGANIDKSLRVRFVDINDWCPIKISTFGEKGKTIVIKDEAYEGYFRDFKSWQYYFVPDSLDINALEDKYSSEWKVTLRINVVASNKVNKPIAIECIPRFHLWAGTSQDAWKVQPFFEGGRIALLPVLDVCNTEPLIEVLLRQVKKVMETPPPSWVDTLEIPGEAGLKGAVTTATQALREAESRVKESEVRLSKLQHYKKLLYETGLPLQEVVKSTFEELGATSRPSVVTDEFIISIKGGDALIEVKGVRKSITKDDIGQLVVDKGNHIKATGQDIKGILVGNAWRHLPLEQRDSKGKPIFPKEIVDIAQNHDIGLISTIQLFKAFCNLREEPQREEEILNKIITGRGIITLQ